MNKPHSSNAYEPLWSISQPALDRLNSASTQDQKQSAFLLSGIYCVIIIFMLTIFGIAALVREETNYAFIIFGFAITIFVSFTLIWNTDQKELSPHFIVTIMGFLGLYLFYSGGTENTGPIYYLGFPSFALFLQGLKQGAVSTVLLFVLTMILYVSEMFNFDSTKYTHVYISRIAIIYIIISAMSFLFAYFRESAQTESILNRGDLEQLSSIDPLTGLANKNFMEKMLMFELRRFKRHRSPFSTIMLSIDNFDELHESMGSAYSNALLIDSGIVILRSLRNYDTPCRWRHKEFMILLPESSKEDAQIVAERILRGIQENFNSEMEQSIQITASAGIYQVDESALEPDDIYPESNDSFPMKEFQISDIVHRTAKNLFQAAQQAPNSIVKS